MLAGGLVGTRMWIRTVDPAVGDGLPLPVEDVDGERSLEVGQDRDRVLRLELVEREDGVVPPARHVKNVLEDGGRVQVLNRGPSQDGLAVIAVVVHPLDEVEVRVDPVDVPENIKVSNSLLNIE